MQLFAPKMPDGLVLVDDFLTVEEHDRCIAVIDALPWSGELRRRTQHYGSKYDYQTGRAAGPGTAPDAPHELVDLAGRLFRQEFFDKQPDQIIVNEYLVDNNVTQGISAHRDRMDCFGEAIATVSLVESWEMRFSCEDEPSIDVLLPKGSAAIMTGASRYEWKHSIPARRNDVIQNVKVPRHRRVSLTFRMLIAD